MSMKNLVIIVLLPFTFGFAESFKDLWRCETTCVSYKKNCDYHSNVSIYLKYIYGQYSNTICHQYKGDKEYCTKIIEWSKEIDSFGEVVMYIGEAITYSVGDDRLFLSYKGQTVGHYECVVEYNVK